MLWFSAFQTLYEAGAGGREGLNCSGVALVAHWSGLGVFELFDEKRRPQKVSLNTKVLPFSPFQTCLRGEEVVGAVTRVMTRLWVPWSQ